ncbi:MAG: DNA primase [Gammaproteobacteria bacterium]|nr:DNA primase [Gammaproteobacteria bacterium]
MAGRIPERFIDQLLNRVDIVDVIDSRVPLRKAGGEYKACCPFHDEKTPSFTVSPAKQFYHCFGCGAHGSAIGFLMQYANFSFVEAVEELAAMAGLQVPRERAKGQGGQGGRAGPGGAAGAEQTAPLLEVVAEANRWFQQQLRAPHGQAAVDYLKQRGLDGRTAADFGIGYAPDNWSGLADALGGGGKSKQLQQAGLLMRRDSAGGNSGAGPGTGTGTGNSGPASAFYDRFRHRVMFPIEDSRGRVVGFGGRMLGDGEPKYLNSPETPLFHKGSELYHLHRARRAVGQAGRAIVVEGYMDVVALAQFGVGNAVATLGTATTRAHIQRLFRLAPGIVFCFDGDRAGRAAAWKALQSALPEMHDGRRAAFLFLPDGEDPDSVVRAEGGDGFAGRVEQATALEDFLFETLTAQVDMASAAGRAALVAAAKPLLAQLPREALREALTNRLRFDTGLAAHQIDAGPGAEHVHGVHGRGRRRGSGHAGAGRGRDAMRQAQLAPLALALSLLLQHPRLASSIADREWGALRRLDENGAEVLLALLDKIAADPVITTARLLESMRAAPSYARLAELAARPHLVAAEALESQFNDTLARLLQQHTERRRLHLIERLRRAPAAEKRQLQRELKALLDARSGVGGAAGGGGAAGAAGAAAGESGGDSSRAGGGIGGDPGGAPGGE